MSRIYTRSGDKGTTALIGGERVAKNDARVEAYGTVEELGAHLALLADFASEAGLDSMVTLLDGIAVELMVVESQLALSDSFKGEITKVTPEMVAHLEEQIDALSTELPPFAGFTIPGGHRVTSQCHICRTVCRRAERRIITAAEHYAIADSLVGYINRLSDLLYTLSRWSCARLGVAEKIWRK